MNIHNVAKGKSYLITTKTNVNVVDVESGYIMAVIPANTQRTVIAISDKFETVGECIVSPFE